MVKKQASDKAELTIKVEKVGEFGVLSGNQWYSISQYSELEPTSFEAGKTYKVLVAYSKKTNKPYISEIINDETPVLPYAEITSGKVSSPKPPTEPTKKDITITRLSIWAGLNQSPWVANYLVSLPPERQLEVLVEIAHKVEEDVLR